MRLAVLGRNRISPTSNFMRRRAHRLACGFCPSRLAGPKVGPILILQTKPSLVPSRPRSLKGCPDKFVYVEIDNAAFRKNNKSPGRKIYDEHPQNEVFEGRA